MIKHIEKKINNRLIDWIIGGSYLNDYRTNIFEKLKKTGLDAYAHLLVQLERLKKRYRD